MPVRVFVLNRTRNCVRQEEKRKRRSRGISDFLTTKTTTNNNKNAMGPHITTLGLLLLLATSADAATFSLVGQTVGDTVVPAGVDEVIVRDSTVAGDLMFNTTVNSWTNILIENSVVSGFLGMTVALNGAHVMVVGGSLGSFQIQGLYDSNCTVDGVTVNGQMTVKVLQRASLVITGVTVDAATGGGSYGLQMDHTKTDSNVTLRDSVFSGAVYGVNLRATATRVDYRIDNVTMPLGANAFYVATSTDCTMTVANVIFDTAYVYAWRGTLHLAPTVHIVTKLTFANFYPDTNVVGDFVGAQIGHLDFTWVKPDATIRVGGCSLQKLSFYGVNDATITIDGATVAYIWLNTLTRVTLLITGVTVDAASGGGSYGFHAVGLWQDSNITIRDSQFSGSTHGFFTGAHTRSNILFDNLTMPLGAARFRFGQVVDCNVTMINAAYEGGYIYQLLRSTVQNVPIQQTLQVVFLDAGVVFVDDFAGAPLGHLSVSNLRGDLRIVRTAVLDQVTLTTVTDANILVDGVTMSGRLQLSSLTRSSVVVTGSTIDATAAGTAGFRLLDLIDSNATLRDSAISGSPYGVYLQYNGVFTRSSCLIDNVTMPNGIKHLTVAQLVESNFTVINCDGGFSVELHALTRSTAVFQNSAIGWLRVDSTMTDSTILAEHVSVAAGATYGILVIGVSSGSTLTLRYVSIATTTSAVRFQATATACAVTLNNVVVAGATDGLYFLAAVAQGTVNLTDSVLDVSNRACRFGGALADSSVAARNVTVAGTGDYGISFDGTVATSVIDARESEMRAAVSAIQFHAAVSAGTVVALHSIYAPGAPSFGLMFDGPWSDSSITACDFRPQTFSVGAASNTVANILNGTCITNSSTLSAVESASRTATRTATATGTETATRSRTHSTQMTLSGSHATTASVAATESVSVAATESVAATKTGSMPRTVTPTLTRTRPPTATDTTTTSFRHSSSATLQPTQLVAAATRTGRYAAVVMVSVASGSNATGLTAIAYSNSDASPVAYGTVSADTSCSNITMNRSIVCSSSATPWAFALHAAAPAYARHAIFVDVHVRAADAAPVYLRVVLTAGTSAADSPPAAATPSGDVISAAVGLRSVFSFKGGCDAVKTPVLLITVLLLGVLLVARGIHATRGAAGDAIPAEDATASRAVARQHAWVGAAWPCHRFCGPVHAAVFGAHVLTMMAVVSALLTTYHALAADTAVVVFFGAFAAVVSTGVAAVLDAPFRWFTLEAATATYASAPYRPHDLAEFGVARNPAVGVGARTVAGLPLVAAHKNGDAAPVNGVDGQVWYGATVAVSVGRSRVLGGCLVAAVAVTAGATTLANTLPWCGARYHTFERTVLAAVLLDCLAVQPAAVAFALLWRWMRTDDVDESRSLRARQHPVPGQTMPDPADLDASSDALSGLPDGHCVGQEPCDATQVAVARDRRLSYVTHEAIDGDDVSL
jgi:hypothetical protein